MELSLEGVIRGSLITIHSTDRQDRDHFVVQRLLPHGSEPLSGFRYYTLLCVGLVKEGAREEILVNFSYFSIEDLEELEAFGHQIDIIPGVVVVLPEHLV